MCCVLEPKSEAFVHSKGLAEHGRDYLLERADFWERRGPLPPRPPMTAVGWKMQRQQIITSRQTSQMSFSTNSTTTPEPLVNMPGVVECSDENQLDDSKSNSSYSTSNSKFERTQSPRAVSDKSKQSPDLEVEGRTTSPEYSKVNTYDNGPNDHRQRHSPKLHSNQEQAMSPNKHSKAGQVDNDMNENTKPLESYQEQNKSHLSSASLRDDGMRNGNANGRQNSPPSVSNRSKPNGSHTDLTELPNGHADQRLSPIIQWSHTISSGRDHTPIPASPSIENNHFKNAVNDEVQTENDVSNRFKSSKQGMSGIQEETSTLNGQPNSEATSNCTKSQASFNIRISPGHDTRQVKSPDSRKYRERSPNESFA